MSNTMSLQHLLNINSLSAECILDIFARAQSIIDIGAHKKQIKNTLAEKTIALLFFENSTRTRISFELAAKRLGATVLNVDIQSSALSKGETVLDMLVNLQAMFCQMFVVRHRDNNFADNLAKELMVNLDNNAAAEKSATIINAGSGTAAHPSQALLDGLTILQEKKDFRALKIAIVGDIVHSRVAASQLALFAKLEVAEVRIIAPEMFLPRRVENKRVSVYNDLQTGLNEVDVVIALRAQKERWASASLDDATYIKQYCLTKQSLASARDDVIVLHPGPINRGIEIASDLADGKHSRIIQQVSNGVAVRMALLEMLAERSH